MRSYSAFLLLGVSFFSLGLSETLSRPANRGYKRRRLNSNSDEEASLIRRRRIQEPTTSRQYYDAPDTSFLTEDPDLPDYYDGGYVKKIAAKLDYKDPEIPDYSEKEYVKRIAKKLDKKIPWKGQWITRDYVPDWENGNVSTEAASSQDGNSFVEAPIVDDIQGDTRSSNYANGITPAPRPSISKLLEKNSDMKRETELESSPTEETFYGEQSLFKKPVTTDAERTTFLRNSPQRVTPRRRTRFDYPRGGIESIRNEVEPENSFMEVTGSESLNPTVKEQSDKQENIIQDIRELQESLEKEKNSRKNLEGESSVVDPVYATVTPQRTEKGSRRVPPHKPPRTFKHLVNNADKPITHRKSLGDSNLATFKPNSRPRLDTPFEGPYAVSPLLWESDSGDQDLTDIKFISKETPEPIYDEVKDRIISPRNWEEDESSGYATLSDLEPSSPIVPEPRRTTDTPRKPLDAITEETSSVSPKSRGLFRRLRDSFSKKKRTREDVMKDFMDHTNSDVDSTMKRGFFQRLSKRSFSRKLGQIRHDHGIKKNKKRGFLSRLKNRFYNKKKKDKNNWRNSFQSPSVFRTNLSGRRFMPNVRINPVERNLGQRTGESSVETGQRRQNVAMSRPGMSGGSSNVASPYRSRGAKPKQRLETPPPLPPKDYGSYGETSPPLPRKDYGSYAKSSPPLPPKDYGSHAQTSPPRPRKDYGSYSETKPPRPSRAYDSYGETPDRPFKKQSLTNYDPESEKYKEKFGETKKEIEKKLDLSHAKDLNIPKIKKESQSDSNEKHTHGFQYLREDDLFGSIVDLKTGKAI